jgi:hypothetical protein
MAGVLHSIGEIDFPSESSAFSGDLWVRENLQSLLKK